MTDTMLPMLRQMLDADGDAVRAGILLSAPTGILLRWRVEFEKCCRKARFEEGADYLTLLRASVDATRIDGLLPPPLQLSLETARRRLVAMARGEEAARPSATRAAGGGGSGEARDGGGALAAEIPPSVAFGDTSPPHSGVADGRQADRLPGDEVAP